MSGGEGRLLNRRGCHAARLEIDCPGSAGLDCPAGVDKSVGLDCSAGLDSSAGLGCRAVLDSSAGLDCSAGLVGLDGVDSYGCRGDSWVAHVDDGSY